ncbi:hypothetical protein QTN25_008198 [Entamoeba marina]
MIRSKRKVRQIISMPPREKESSSSSSSSNSSSSSEESTSSSSESEEVQSHSEQNEKDDSIKEKEVEEDKGDKSSPEFIPVEDAPIHSVFVKNIPYSWERDDLFNYFESYGPIKTRVITSMEDGRSRGFGYLDFDDKTIADKVINEMNGSDVEGRALYLDHAESKRKGGDSSNLNNRGSGSGCYNCGEQGHMSRDCPNKQQGGFRQQRGGRQSNGRSNGCYNCGEQGHMSRDCPKAQNQQGGYRQQRGGRPSNGRQSSGRSNGCYNCGEQGHMSRDCPSAQNQQGGFKRQSDSRGNGKHIRFDD